MSNRSRTELRVKSTSIRQPSSPSSTGLTATTNRSNDSCLSSALTTSSLVIAEGHGWFLRRYDRRRATQFLAFLDALPTLVVQGFDVVELSKVRKVLAQVRDQNLTLADAHGLVVMKDRRIASCWSTDRHMGLTGADLQPALSLYADSAGKGIGGGLRRKIAIISAAATPETKPVAANQTWSG